MSNQTLRGFSLPFGALAWLASSIAAHAAQVVPGTFEAEDFDQGGEGPGYHENTPGNQGDANYRTGEDVDIFVSNDPAGGGRIIKNFESGEWLAYTLSVPSDGDYYVALRVATNAAFPNSSYYIQVDGINVTGIVTLPDTGGWDHYQWLGERMIFLTAGTHLLRVVAVTPYFALNSIRIASTASPAPYYGAPSTIGGLIEAEAFDRGGEGVGYHDNTPGNQGDSGFRAGEDVDIFVTNDAGSGSPYVVKNLEVGEWLAYTINAPTTRNYYFSLRASSQADFPNPAYHLEVDGVNVTGIVYLEDTGGWDSYRPTSARQVMLTSGIHVVKVVVERAYFSLNAIMFDYNNVYSLPGQIEAEEFYTTIAPDVNPEGTSYHDNTRGNQGDTGDTKYRYYDVDVFRSNDTGSGSWYIVKNFEAGEWLRYQVNASPGIYTLELRASTHPDFPGSAYHVDVNGVTVTPSIVLQDTGGWDNYQWIGTTQIELSGNSSVKIVVDNPYFSFNTLRLTLN